MPLRAVRVGFDCRRQNGDIFPPFMVFYPLSFSPGKGAVDDASPEGRPGEGRG